MAKTNRENERTEAVKNSIFLCDWEVASLLSVGRSTIWKWSKSGRIPKPVKLTARCSRWRRSDILEYVASVM